MKPSSTTHKQPLTIFSWLTYIPGAQLERTLHKNRTRKIEKEMDTNEERKALYIKERLSSRWRWKRGGTLGLGFLLPYPGPLEFRSSGIEHSEIHLCAAFLYAIYY
jgi:hypothetical protein